MSDFALKAATRRLVDKCGGQESCALIPGIRKKRHQAFSEYGDAGEPTHWIGLDLVRALERDCGVPEVTRELARQAGYELVKAPVACSTGAALRSTGGEALAEIGGVVALLGPLLADLHSRAEAGRLIQEIDEAVPALLALRAQLEQEGGK